MPSAAGWGARGRGRDRLFWEERTQPTTSRRGCLVVAPFFLMPRSSGGFPHAGTHYVLCFGCRGEAASSAVALALAPLISGSDPSDGTAPSGYIVS